MPSLVPSNKILLPPLRTKSVSMKSFVKAMDKTGAGFIYLTKNFSRISDAKVKEDTFIDLQTGKAVSPSW